MVVLVLFAAQSRKYCLSSTCVSTGKKAAASVHVDEDDDDDDDDDCDDDNDDDCCFHAKKDGDSTVTHTIPLLLSVFKCWYSHVRFGGGCSL